jgi:hypothetical protein
MMAALMAELMVPQMAEMKVDQMGMKLVAMKAAK